jgi:hypothetical protein
VQASGGKVHLIGAVTTEGTAGASLGTQLAAMYPATFSTWQADVAVVADTPGGAGSNAAQIGGAFLNDGTPGGANDSTGDVVSEVFVRSGSASIWVARCLDPACGSLTTLVTQALTPAAGHPLGVGTVHTVYQHWDVPTRTFTYKLDDAAPVQVVPSLATVAAPRVPSRHVRAVVGVPAGTAAGTAASVEVTVANVVVQ